MAVLTGNNVSVWVDGTRVESITSSSLSFSNQLTEVTKGITNTFSESISGVKSGNINVEGFFDAIFLNNYSVGDKVLLRVGTRDSSLISEALIETIDLSAPSDEAVSRTISFKVTGDLTRFIPIFRLDRLITNTGDNIITDTGDQLVVSVQDN